MYKPKSVPLTPPSLFPFQLLSPAAAATKSA